MLITLNFAVRVGAFVVFASGLSGGMQWLSNATLRKCRRSASRRNSSYKWRESSTTSYKHTFQAFYNASAIHWAVFLYLATEIQTAKHQGKLKQSRRSNQYIDAIVYGLDREIDIDLVIKNDKIVTNSSESHQLFIPNKVSMSRCA
ncbi:unnamed protein product [Umbelopsis ramanniana]